MTQRTEADQQQAKFAQVCRNLKILADQLRRQHPEYPDFPRAYLAVALDLMLESVGDEVTAAYLRDLAEGLDRGEGAELPPAN